MPQGQNYPPVTNSQRQRKAVNPHAGQESYGGESGQVPTGPKSSQGQNVPVGSRGGSPTDEGYFGGNPNRVVQGQSTAPRHPSIRNK